MVRYAILLSLFLSASFGIRNLTPSSPAGAVPVLTQHNDNQRTGANLNETILNTSNVHSGSFGKLFAREVDGHIYAQPLYVPDVSIPNHGIHNVVYVATQHNSVYAFDADFPLASAPLWNVNLGPSAPVPADFGNRYGPYNDISVEVGITSTPVIDLGTSTLYVVTFNRDPVPATCPCVYRHFLHALDIASGIEKFGGPVQIAGSVPGVGVDSHNGVVTFDSHQQIQRSSLLLSNGVVYIAFAGYSDTDPYHGWLFGYNAATLALVSIFNTTPNAIASDTEPNPGEGGIWQSGEGPSADSNGYVYVITGNGSFSANTGGVDYGNSFLKLNPQNIQNGILSVADWFTTYNQQFLSSVDLDLGSTGALLIPGTNFIVGGGKEGVLYLVDKTNMGHYNGPGGPDLVAQRFAVSSAMFNSPILWNRPTGRLVYLWGSQGPLKAYSFNGSLFQTTPVATGSTVLTQAFPGGAISLSADGSDPNTGIVWASHPAPGSGTSTSKQGVLRAYDASDISIELWNSEADLSGHDRVGLHTKYNAPTIADGKVYLGTSSNQLAVYGLILDNNTIFLPSINN